MELLSRALRDQNASFMDHLDLIFKWISLRLCEKENVKAMGQVCLVSLRLNVEVSMARKGSILSSTQQPLYLLLDYHSKFCQEYHVPRDLSDSGVSTYHHHVIPYLF